MIRLIYWCSVMGIAGIESIRTGNIAWLTAMLVAMLAIELTTECECGEEDDR